MRPPATEHQRRRRAGIGVSVIAVAVLSALALAGSLMVSHYLTRQPAPVPAPTPSGPAPVPDPGGWDLPAEHALASAPMAALPQQSIQPQPMSTDQAADPIPVPPAGQTSGFPDSPEGALGQLKTLEEAALRGGDPDTYARGYQQLALTGAPRPETTGLFALLRSMRTSAGLSPTGPLPDLTVTYQVNQGQIKGVTDGGRYVVACVLGQLSVDHQGQTLTAGVGDCQSLRRVGDTWRLSPGPLPAPAPSAWPGSADAVHAGYRDLTGGG